MPSQSHLREAAFRLSTFPMSLLRALLIWTHSHDGETPFINQNRTVRLRVMLDVGECKPIVADYLRCLRRVKGTNDQECRLMAKEYLRCRMEQCAEEYIAMDCTSADDDQ